MLLLTACGGDKSAGQIIKYDIPGGVTNLDPQFTTDATARMIISNAFEGLFRQLPSGEIVPCLVDTYDVSPDGLIYTFHLRDDAKWSNPELKKDKTHFSDQPVTAYDFEFAMLRMFDPAAFSPYASNFASIKNANLILLGAAPRESLGVRALDSTTLEIELFRPDTLLPELLSSSAAMPCNKTFFESTRARYGLDLSNLMFNGPYYVRSWNNQKGISLRSNKLYATPETRVAAGVDFYIPSANPELKTHDPVERFLAGVTDACKVDYTALPAVLGQEGSSVAFEDTVWVLVLNTRLPHFANADIRKALAHTVDRSLFADYLPDNLSTTAMLIPPAISTMGQSFRDYAGDESPIVLSADLAKRYYQSGLADLGLSTLPLNELLVLNENNHPMLAGYVQRGWQKSLSISTGLVQLSEAELLERVRKGDFQAAIVPLSPAYSSPDAVFSYFKSDSSMRMGDYKNEQLDALLAQTTALTGLAQYEIYKQAEQLLLADCAVIPLFFETTYYAMGKGVSDIAFSPFLSNVYFSGARKE